MDYLKKIKNKIIGSVLVAFVFITEKVIAVDIGIDASRSISLYGVIDPSYGEERAWYYIFSRPIVYVICLPTLLLVGVVSYIIIKRRKKNKKNEPVKRDKKDQKPR